MLCMSYITAQPEISYQSIIIPNLTLTLTPNLQSSMSNFNLHFDDMSQSGRSISVIAVKGLSKELVKVAVDAAKERTSAGISRCTSIPVSVGSSSAVSLQSQPRNQVTRKTFCHLLPCLIYLILCHPTQCRPLFSCLI
jgi:hypothetical protein